MCWVNGQWPTVVVEKTSVNLSNCAKLGLTIVPLYVIVFQWQRYDKLMNHCLMFFPMCYMIVYTPGYMCVSSAMLLSALLYSVRNNVKFSYPILMRGLQLRVILESHQIM